MRNIQYSKTKKAFVLSLVLWITAAIMLLSLLFVRFTKEEVLIYKKLHDKLEVELQVESLFEKLNFYITTGVFQTEKVYNNFENFPEKIFLDNTEYNITERNISCTFRLLDHSGLYNLNNMLYYKQVDRYIAQTCDQREYSFSDIYLDWVDRDDFARLNGAEKSDYMLDDYKYIPLNMSAFQNNDSIELLKGIGSFSEKCIKNLKKHISAYSQKSINIFLIDKPVLKSFFPDLNDAEITNLINLRQTDKKEYQKYFSFLPYELYDIYPSKFVSIRLQCTANGVSAKLFSIVDYNLNAKQGFSIIEYKKK